MASKPSRGRQSSCHLDGLITAVAQFERAEVLLVEAGDTSSMALRMASTSMQATRVRAPSMIILANSGLSKCCFESAVAAMAT